MRERWESGASRFHAGLLERFWAFVEQRGREDCWAWLGKFDKYGAPALHYGLGQYRPRRIAFQVRYGHIPQRHYIRSRCGVSWCMNPDHLVLAEKVKTATGTRYRNGNGRKNGTPRN